MARVLTPSQFGYYALAVSIGYWVWNVADAGLTAHGTKLISSGMEVKSVAGRIYRLRLLILVASGIAVVVFLLFFPVSNREKLLYSLTWVYLLGMSVFPAWIARSRHDNMAYAVSYSLVAIAGCVFLYFMVAGVVKNNEISAFLFRNLAWVIGAGVALIFVMRREDFSISLLLLPDVSLLKKTAPLGLAAILYTLIPLMPFVFIRMNGWVDRMGQYGAVWQFQQVLIAGAAVVPMVLLPSYSKYVSSCNDQSGVGFLRRVFPAVIASAFALCVAYFLLGSIVIERLFGHEYEGLSDIVAPFSAALFFVFIRLSTDSVLIVHGVYRRMVLNGFIALSVVVFLSFSSADPVRLAWSYASGEFVLVILNAFYSARVVISKKV